MHLISVRVLQKFWIYDRGRTVFLRCGGWRERHNHNIVNVERAIVMCMSVTRGAQPPPSPHRPAVKVRAVLVSDAPPIPPIRPAAPSHAPTTAPAPAVCVFSSRFIVARPAVRAPAAATPAVHAPRRLGGLHAMALICRRACSACRDAMWLVLFFGFPFSSSLFLFSSLSLERTTHRRACCSL